MTKVVINKTHNNFKPFILDIQKYFANSEATIHKARNELKIIEHNNISTIVKSFKKPHILNRIIYSYFKDSKAKKSYDYSLKIAKFTPTPIAYIEFYSGGLIDESYFISERFDYDFTIREPLLDVEFKDKESILRAFARFSLELHNNGIFHNDYSPGNILIKRDAGEFIFKIVDINRMSFLELQEDDRAKNFSKLWARDDELAIVVDEYVKYATCSDDFLEQVCNYSNNHKKSKNFKKRLKGQEVND